MPLLSEAFWQQDIPQSKFPLWFVRRNVAIGCNLICGSFHLILGIVTLLVISNNTWEIDFPYDPTTANNVTLTMDAERTNVFVHVEMSNCYTNYRTFAMSKDDNLVGSSLSPFDCDTHARGGNDMFFIRGKTFAMGPEASYKYDDVTKIQYGPGPSEIWINADGLFGPPGEAVGTGADGDAAETPKFPTYVRYRHKANDAWRYANATESEVNAIKAGAHEYQLPLSRIYPCGLNSMSMYFDRFRLIDPGTPEKELTFRQDALAWQSDIDFVTQKNALKEDDNDATQMFIEDKAQKPVKWEKSWLRPFLPGYEEHTLQNGIPIQRLLTWYRNPASSTFRMLLGKFDSLKAGDYKLEFLQRDPEWEEWGVNTKLVFSQLSIFGSRNYVIPVLCLIVGIVQLAFALFLAIYKKKKGD